MLTIDGISSGLDTTKIVEGLLEIQQRRLDQLETRRDGIQRQQAAYQSLEAQLLTLRSSVTSLSRSQGNPFLQRSVSVSHEEQLTASASPRAAIGIYRFQINQLATAHQLATNGLSDAEAAINQGTLGIRTGSGATTTITVDSSNNTLGGLAETINLSGSGVSASIVRDDSGGSPAFRLLLTASRTGADQQITITNNLTTTTGGSVQPDFSREVQAAGNAQVSMGSGPGALTVESADNELNELVDGVTINLLRAAPGQDVSLTVTQESEAAVKAVEDFVATFNDVLEFIDTQTRFDAETNQAGLLQGQRSPIGIQDRLRNAILGAVPGLSQSANRLSVIGVSVTDQGRLTLDSSRLTDVLQGKVPGVSAADLHRLFSVTGSSTNPGIRFTSGSSRTLASSTPYQVDLTQAAQRATLSATSALAGSTVIDNTNNALLLSLDGATATLTLASGTYTPQELSSHVESLINGSPQFAGRGVAAALDAGLLKLTSLSFGSESRLTINGGSSLGALGFTIGQSAIGIDVAGTFIVNGQNEPATGQGRRLTGNPSNLNTADLQLQVNLGSAGIIAGSEAEITVTRGVAARLDDVLADILDPVNGDLAIIDDGFERDLESIQRTTDRQTALFESKRDSLLAQFAQLEGALAQIQSIGNLLGTQLASLNARR